MKQNSEFAVFLLNRDNLEAKKPEINDEFPPLTHLSLLKTNSNNASGLHVSDCGFLHHRHRVLRKVFVLRLKNYFIAVSEKHFAVQ